MKHTRLYTIRELSPSLKFEGELCVNWVINN